MFSYEIEIICQSDAVAQVIRAAAIGSVAERTVRIELPSGEIMDVEAASLHQFWERHGATEPVLIQEYPVTQVRLFPVDHDVREYCRTDPRGELLVISGQEYAKLSGIWLRVSSGEKYAAVRIGPTSNMMSLLFRGSRAIHGYFLDVMQKTGALAGIIHNIDDFDLYLLDDPQCKLPLSLEWSYHHGRSSGPAYDRFIEELLRQIEAMS